MSKQMNEKQNLAAGSGPPPFGAYNAGADRFAQRGPPPSYEESQRLTVPAQCPPYMQAYSTSQYQASMANGAYGGSYSMQAQYQYDQPMTGVISPSAPMVATHNYQMQAYGSSSSPQVLALAKGAKLRTTATGAAIIPPPPPGIAPTPAQYAAMQGQPVFVKKTKKSFF